MLDQIAVATGVGRSNVICALIRVAAGGKPRPGEEAISALLKRAIGRESMLQFLTAVAEVIGTDAKAVPHSKPNGNPEAWVYPSGVGVLAFFQPNEANVGDIFTKASKLMADNSLKRVIVATTNGHTLDGAFRERLGAAGIDLVALADLRGELAKFALKKGRFAGGGPGRAL